MTDNDDRMTRFESRLDALGEDVGVLKDDVGTLKKDVHRLHVSYEEQKTTIQVIAEVQTRHGDVLDEHSKALAEIKQALIPLGDIQDFVKRIGHDHEPRIDALEQRTGLTPRS